MNNRDCAVLAFKLLGLYLLAQAATNLAGMPYFWAATSPEKRLAAVGFMALPSIVGLGIAVQVWFSAEWFAGRVFTPGPGTGRLRVEPLFALGVALIGVLLLCEGLPRLASGLSLFVQSRQSGPFGPDTERQLMVWHAGAKANTIEAGARVVLGVLCLVGPARISAALARLRRELRSTLTEDAPAGGEQGTGSSGQARG